MKDAGFEEFVINRISDSEKNARKKNWPARHPHSLMYGCPPILAYARGWGGGGPDRRFLCATRSFYNCVCRRMWLPRGVSTGAARGAAAVVER